MATPRIEHYTTDVHAHWEGSRANDWSEVDLRGYETATDRMFQKLCENPDAAHVEAMTISSMESSQAIRLIQSRAIMNIITLGS
ncbi:unnamed protein product [Penicillium pancosmium]